MSIIIKCIFKPFILFLLSCFCQIFVKLVYYSRIAPWNCLYHNLNCYNIWVPGWCNCGILRPWIQKVVNAHTTWTGHQVIKQLTVIPVCKELILSLVEANLLSNWTSSVRISRYAIKLAWIQAHRLLSDACRDSPILISTAWVLFLKPGFNSTSM